MNKIAFIGLGNMGAPMAKNLVKSGHHVCGFDLISDTLSDLKKAGGHTAESVSLAVEESNVIISMLPTSQHVESLYLGEDALLSKIVQHALVIDCSTIDSGIAKKVGLHAKENNIHFVDAPVSGGIAGAAAGTLTFMVGGDTDAVNIARPYLEIMGQNIFHAGDTGSGQMAKICNNMLLAILMTGTSEALKLGIDNGLDATVLSEIISKSSGGNWVLNQYNPVPGIMPQAPASNDYQGGFMVDLMIKDLSLVLDAAKDSKTPTPMTSLANNLYRMHSNRSGGDQDFSSIIKFYS